MKGDKNMESQKILENFRREVQAGNLLGMEQLEPCDDFFTTVDGKGSLMAGEDLDPQDPKTWAFVLYKQGFCQSTAGSGVPFIQRVGNVLQCQMIGKFLAYNPFAGFGLKTATAVELVGFTLKPGIFLVRIGKRE